jgi:hypothetical protein
MAKVTVIARVDGIGYRAEKSDTPLIAPDMVVLGQQRAVRRLRKALESK